MYGTDGLAPLDEDAVYEAAFGGACIYCDGTRVVVVCACPGPVHTCCAPEDRPADCEWVDGRLVAPCSCATKEG